MCVCVCVCVLCRAVYGVAGAEGGAVHLAEVHAAAANTRHQHTAVCLGRGRTVTYPGPIHPLCQLGSPAHGSVPPFTPSLLSFEMLPYHESCEQRQV